MNIFLAILLIFFMIATLVALIRGIVTFLRTTEEELKSGATGPSLSSRKQNKMMIARIGFQAAAVVIVVLLLLLKR
ncbi:MAG: twin transmembrane helix small protein [Sphingomonadaceae bacterium]|nr:twin transmembrane helix small protein [Sphingomonadaceae bacterium]